MEFQLTEEQEMMRKMIRDFAENEVAPGATERDENEEFSRELFDKLAELEVTGLPFPEEYGGAESDYISYAIAAEEISRVDASLGTTLSAHISLASWPIYNYGTEEQKQKFLKPLCLGEKLGAFGLTEESAGSDAAAQKTSARREGDEYVLNGNKIFISNAGYAEIYVVFAVTDPEDKAKGVSAFIVEKDTPGFSFGKKEKKMGIRSSATMELVFEDCRIPAENLLGKEGDGMKIALSVLDGGRVGVAAQSVGIAQGALDAAVEYSKQREQFGQSISRFQAVSFMLAEAATKIEAARLLTLKAAYLKEQGMPYSMYSSMAKLYAAEVSMEITTNMVQVFGGYGYTKEYPVERYMRDAKITQIYEGTSEIQKLVIARNLLKG